MHLPTYDQSKTETKIRYVFQSFRSQTAHNKKKVKTQENFIPYFCFVTIGVYRKKKQLNVYHQI